MSKLGRLRGRELVATLRRAEFEVVRIKGSHHRLRHPDSRCTTVPVHKGETIGTGLLMKILADSELSMEELQELL